MRIRETVYAVISLLPNKKNKSNVIVLQTVLTSLKLKALAFAKAICGISGVM